MKCNSNINFTYTILTMYAISLVKLSWGDYFPNLNLVPYEQNLVTMFFILSYEWMFSSSRTLFSQITTPFLNKKKRCTLLFNFFIDLSHYYFRFAFYVLPHKLSNFNYVRSPRSPEITFSWRIFLALTTDTLQLPF